MSQARAQALLLERLGSMDTAICSLHYALPMTPAWADGQDVDGASVLLVGAHHLGSLPAGEEYLTEVLRALRRGEQMAGVHSIRYEPRMSEGAAEILDGPADEILLWGSRNSGKTQGEGGVGLGLAELHARAGFPLPLRILWLHSSLVDASAKTARSLEEPLWGGLWRLEQDRRVAIAALGGREYVAADFVAVQDVTTKERLRSSCHVVFGEEAVGTLDDAGGIGEREYTVALTSMMRLKGRRRVAVLTTNPGSREHWCYTRFLADGHEPTRLAMHVPSRDRLTEAEVEAQAAPFRDSPDLEMRLVREQWVDLKLGPEVAVGYNPTRHVAAEPQWLAPGAPITIGWDTAPASHVHAAVICQRNGPQIRVFGTFAVANGTLKQLVDQMVLPFLLARARWALGESNAREYLVHAMDPSASTYEGLAAGFTAEQVIKQALGGGKFREGATHWSPRLTPLLAVLSPNSEVVLKFDPGPTCDLGRRALAGMWHYDMSRGGGGMSRPLLNLRTE